MGRAKAWLPWRGQPMLAHVVACLREVVDEVVVVTSEELDPPPVDALVVRDSAPAEGPLQGLAEGLARVRAPLAFATGTDAPFLCAEFVRALFAYGEPVAPVVGEIVQTLAAVYPRAAATEARALLAAGRRRPLALLEAVAFRRLDASKLPRAEALQGFNTPDEYLAAVASEHEADPVSLEFAGDLAGIAGAEGVEAPVGTLAQVLACAPPRLVLFEGDAVLPRYRVTVEDRERLVETRVPVGPGERIVVRAASGEDTVERGLQ